MIQQRFTLGNKNEQNVKKKHTKDEIKRTNDTKAQRAMTRGHLKIISWGVKT